jgi:hypothetical protein
MVYQVLIMTKQRTIITKDGFVTGFDYALIDPMATQQKAYKLLAESAEQKQFEVKRAEYSELFNKFNMLCLESAAVKRTSGEFDSNLQKQIKDMIPDLETLETEVNHLAQQLSKKSDQLKKDNLIYFEPKQGEKTVDENTFVSLQKKMLSKKSFENVKETGEVVVDEERKALEKESALNNALIDAANFRARLEIEKDPDALKKSQDWFEARKLEIEKEFE